MECPAESAAEVTVQRQYSAKRGTSIWDAVCQPNQGLLYDTVSETQGVKAGVALLTAMPSDPSGDLGLLVFAILDSVKLEVFILREHILARGHSKIPTEL